MAVSLYTVVVDAHDTPDDQAAEVERIIGLGARRADVGQGPEATWVLTDPEGNEFCVLRPKKTLLE